MSALRFSFVSPLLLLLLFTLASPLPAAEPTVVTMWAMGAEGSALGALLPAFERENPDLRVRTQAIPWTGAHEKLVTAVVGDLTPDVCQLGTTWMAEFAAMGSLDAVEATTSAFFPGALATCRIDGVLRGVPWYVDTRVLYYRKDLLARAGFDHPPATWDELLACSRALVRESRARGEGGYAAALPSNDWNTFLPFLWQAGGDILGPGGRSALGSPAAVEAALAYKRFFDEGLAPLEAARGMDLMASFRSGAIPLFFSGPSVVGELRVAAPELAGRWGTAPMPRHRTGLSFAGGCNLVVFRGTKVPGAARRLLAWLTRPDTQVAWYRLSQALPSVVASWDDPALASDAELAAFRTQLGETRSPPPVPEWERIAGLLNGALERIMYGVEPPDLVLAQLAGETDRIRATAHPQQSALYRLAIVALFLGLIVLALVLWFRGASVPGGRGPLAPGGWLFVAPALTVLSVFLFLPIAASFLMSLTNWDVYAVTDPTTVAVVGLANYARLAADPVFWRAMLNTAVFALVGVPLTVGAGLLAAVALNGRAIRGAPFLRTGFFLPVITTTVAVAVVWRWLYNPDHGVLNGVLGLFGLPPQAWLADERLALPCLILMAVWKGFGYLMMIFLAALQAVPDELYEAADIDGATMLQQFRHITLPHLRRTTLFVSMMTTIGFLQVFAEPYVMTDGGPLNATETVVLSMYRHGFKYYDLGYASAMAWVLFAAILVLTLVQARAAHRYAD